MISFIIVYICLCLFAVAIRFKGLSRFNETKEVLLCVIVTPVIYLILPRNLNN